MPNSIFRWPITCTAWVLRVLLTVQILIGIGLIGLAEFFKRTLLYNLPVPAVDGDWANPLHVYFLQFYGVHLIVHYLFGFVFLRRCRRHGERDVALAIKMWHSFVLLVSLDGLLVYWFYWMGEPELVKSAERAMVVGMDRYFADPLMQFHWDEYQMDKQCCGIRGYADWLKDEWQEIDDGTLEEQVISTVPYSCCRSGVQCVSEHVKSSNDSIDYWTELQNVDISLINPIGCWTALIAKLQRFRYILCGVVILVIFLQVLIYFAFRFLKYAKLVGCAGGPAGGNSVEQHSQTDIPIGHQLTSSDEQFLMWTSDESVRIVNELETPANTTAAITLQQKRANEFYRIR